jgi:transposase
MIRNSKHSIKFANIQKLDKLQLFIAEYRRIGQIIIDTIWENGYEDFNIKNDKLNCPKYLDYNSFNVDTKLSARAMSSLVTQICFNLSAATKKRKQILFIKNKLISENNPLGRIDEILNKYKLIKPNLSNTNPELSSKCCDIEKGNSFDYFLRIKCIGEDFGHIKIPIKNTKVSLKWLTRGKLLNSFSIGSQYISLRFDIKNTNKNEGTKIVGIDQGYKDVATLSDKQTTPKEDIHHHSLETIIGKLSRKKKGSDAFFKSQEHRKNFINWSINQLNFDGVKEVRLEKIWNIGYKNKTSRKLSHWTNTLIRDKIKRKCEELEVPVIEQDSFYRSQRCSCCGLVRKANRKGKVYKCKVCGYEADADYNASLNHAIELPEVDWEFRSQRNNLGKGFYWKESGLFSFDGVDLRVPLSKN